MALLGCHNQRGAAVQVPGIHRVAQPLEGRELQIRLGALARPLAGGLLGLACRRVALLLLLSLRLLLAGCLALLLCLVRVRLIRLRLYGLLWLWLWLLLQGLLLSPPPRLCFHVRLQYSRKSPGRDDGCTQGKADALIAAGEECW